jgi:hypothetical protein
MDLYFNLLTKHIHITLFSGVKREYLLDVSENEQILLLNPDYVMILI